MTFPPRRGWSTCIASPHLRGVSAAILAAAMLVGCVADGPQGRTKAPPRAAPAQPAGIAPTVLEVAAARYANDSDKNGYADELQVTAFLFAPPRDIPVTVPGEFRFRLDRLSGENLGDWTFDADASARSVERLLPGPGYRFRFTLRDHGNDNLPTQDAQLFCEFVPVGGEAIRPRAPIRVTVGKIR